MRSLTKILCFAFVALGSAFSAAADYRVLNHFPIGGDGGYDYLRVDAAERQVYVSHGNQVEVLNADTGEKISVIAGLSGVHGIAIASEFNHGFITSGLDNSVMMFDLKTLKPLSTIKVSGKRPDALSYDRDTKRVYVCDHGSGDVAVIDAANGKTVGSVDLGGALEELVFDGRGHLFVNAEDKNVVHVVDLKTLKALASWSVAPGEGPTGLAVDPVHHRLFAACGNEKLMVLDSDKGSVVSTVTIGTDPDGTVFEPGTGLIFTPTKDGMLSIVHEDGPDKYSVVQNLKTQEGARTIALDEKTGHVLLPTGKVIVVPPTTTGGAPRQKLAPNSFELLVVGK